MDFFYTSPDVEFVDVKCFVSPSQNRMPGTCVETAGRSVEHSSAANPY